MANIVKSKLISTIGDDDQLDQEIWGFFLALNLFIDWI